MYNENNFTYNLNRLLFKYLLHRLKVDILALFFHFIFLHHHSDHSFLQFIWHKNIESISCVVYLTMKVWGEFHVYSSSSDIYWGAFHLFSSSLNNYCNIFILSLCICEVLNTYIKVSFYRSRVTKRATNTS